MRTSPENRPTTVPLPNWLKRTAGSLAMAGALLAGCKAPQPDQKPVSLAALEQAAKAPLPAGIRAVSVVTLREKTQDSYISSASAERVSSGDKTYLISAGHGVKGNAAEHPIDCDKATASLVPRLGLSVPLKAASTRYESNMPTPSSEDITVLFPKDQARAHGSIPRSIPLSSAGPTIGDITYTVGNAPDSNHDMVPNMTAAEYVGKYKGMDVLIEPDDLNHSRPGDSGGSALERDDSQFGITIAGVNSPLTITQLNKHYGLDLTSSPTEHYRAVEVLPIDASMLNSLATGPEACTFQ